ncbi:MAG: sulfite exporter TauE/SafE family protein [Candidatus Acidiferrales bacterium]
MSDTTLLVLAAVAAGAIASVSGFGIGSILTPLLAAGMGTKLAVVIVAIPHFVGTALRFALVRQHVDKRVLLTFGVTSALGGLAGALLHVWLRGAILSYLLGSLLVFAGVMGLTGRAERMRFGRTSGQIAGALSGVFGGLVGNQGGIRSAALLGFEVSKESFVATATAIGLIVDLFRLPVYAATAYQDIAAEWRLILLATAGVVAGTLAGKPLLQRIPQRVYRAIVSLIILALGISMFIIPSEARDLRGDTAPPLQTEGTLALAREHRGLSGSPLTFSVPLCLGG